MSNSETIEYGAELSPVEDALVTVVLEARNGGFSVSNDFARRNSAIVAMAACRQLITTQVHRDVFGKVWLPTVAGLKMLNEVDLGEDDED